MSEKKRILIIDDNEVIHLILKKILEPFYDICGEAFNGEDGFEKYKELNPDLVILDISMPGVSGFGCLKKIKEYDKNAKVIMLTAMDQEAVIEKVKYIGATEFIPKPFKIEFLLEKIKDVINS
ncbi:MAG TPA: response regulator [bacterium]|nr:response regulator [bacterium]HPQ19212.1 response regulator [bacterium]